VYLRYAVISTLID